MLAETVRDPDQLAELIASAGPIAGLFVLVLIFIVILLWRSMRKQLGRIDPSLPPGAVDRRRAAEAEMTEDALARGEQADPPPTQATDPDDAAHT